MHQSPTKRIFKWPIFIFVFFIVAFEFVLFSIFHILIDAIEYFNGIYKRDRKIRKSLEKAIDYNQYSEIAKKLDSTASRTKWINRNDDNIYNFNELNKMYNELIKSENLNDIHGIMQILKLYFQRTIKDYEKEELYSKTYFYTKSFIEKFLCKIRHLLIKIRDSDSVSQAEKINFFKSAIKDNGRAALCLSGGAKLSFYHIGVAFELLRGEIMPGFISGTSGGSIMAAFLSVRTNEEIRNTIDYQSITENLWELNFLRLIKQGYAMDYTSHKEKILKACLGNTTFKEAYLKTGKFLNIAATNIADKENPVMLNHQSAPDVCIWSAVMASSSFPKVLPKGKLYCKTKDNEIKPFNLLGKYWMDGSYKSDVPHKTLREKFNVRYTIVSQANPHVVPFIVEDKGSCGIPPLHRSGKGLKGGFILSAIVTFLRIDMRKWIIVLKQLGITPIIFGYDFSDIVAQKFHGNVTIYAIPKIKDYVCMLHHATNQDVSRMELLGRKACWPKIRMISHRIKLDSLLQNCLLFLNQ